MKRIIKTSACCMYVLAAIAIALIPFAIGFVLSPVVDGFRGGLVRGPECLKRVQDAMMAGLRGAK